jgi:predicted  nucleic acid-binding Zn-ribbon protein
MADPVDLTLERLNRLEQRLREFQDEVKQTQDEANRRLGGIESALSKMVTVLEAHDQRLGLIASRVDRLLEQALRARTQEAERMTDLERRLEALERRPRAT